MSGETPTWIASLRADGHLVFRVGKRGGRRVAEWAGLCTLDVAENGEDARFEVAPEADRALADKVFDGLARGLVRHLGGAWSLHGACIARGGKAILLLGESGAGKSTAAAMLSRLPGAGLVADDIAFLDDRVDGPWVLPSEKRVWLFDESARALGQATGRALPNGKRPYDAPAESEPARLVGIVALTFGTGDPSIRAAEGAELFDWLVPSVVRFAVDDIALRRKELVFLGELLRVVPSYVLTRPRSFEADVLGAGLRCLEGIWE